MAHYLMDLSSHCHGGCHGRCERQWQVLCVGWPLMKWVYCGRFRKKWIIDWISLVWMDRWGFFLSFSLFNKVVYWVSGFWAFENDLDVNWRRVNVVNLYNHFYFFIIINTFFDWIYIYSINPSLFPLCSIIYPHFNNIYLYLFIRFLSLLFFHYYFFYYSRLSVSIYPE